MHVRPNLSNVKHFPKQMAGLPKKSDCTFLGAPDRVWDQFDLIMKNCITFRDSENTPGDFSTTGRRGIVGSINGQVPWDL